ANDVPKAVGAKMRGIAKAANRTGLQVELGGQMFTEQTQPASEAIGVFAAIVILLVAFGSLLAMGLPILTALFGIGIGLAIVQVLAHVIDVPEFAPQVTAMIGIGVGIDYALFIVTRYRDALHENGDPEAAVKLALNTSGRSVLFAGTTVVISLIGLFVIGLGFIQGLAVGASLGVLVVMAASVTLLPAVLGFAGHTIDKLALPGARRRSSDTTNNMWARWSRTLQARPWTAALSGLVLLVVLAIPAFSLRLGSADAGNDPTKQTTRRAYDLLSEGFGKGFNGPLILASEVHRTSDSAAMGRLSSSLAKVDGVVQASPPILSPNRKAVLVQVVPKGSPQDASTTTLIHHLRKDVIPGATSGTGLDVHIGGQTAVFADLADKLGQRLPLFFAAVLLLSFVLLLVVFRSILVPLKAVIMNLLSIGAAYGVVVAIFQWGWLKGVVGIGKAGPIEAWAPMMLFAIVFGLSMDYEVFLLSRIKEDYDLTHDNANAVAHGVAVTARLITAAAAIMICVFGSFVLGDLRVLKLLGIGLASAVLIDATVVRLVLVPATMELLGDRNWWFPKFLDFVPKVNVEAPQDLAPAASGD
ncbi:MAG: MMPL family transporter, partial [Actinomycetota bacterium]|nr:MMPL family transporter [Actinomycetota bacterium]